MLTLKTEACMLYSHRTLPNNRTNIFNYLKKLSLSTLKNSKNQNCNKFIIKGKMG